MEAIKDINRLKVVLAEKKRTNKWLAEQLGKDPATVSKWCTNTAQPGLETLLKIAEVLEVDVKDLLKSSRIDEDGNYSANCMSWESVRPNRLRIALYDV